MQKYYVTEQKYREAQKESRGKKFLKLKAPYYTEAEVLFSGLLFAYLSSKGEGWPLHFAHTGTESFELLQEAAQEGNTAKTTSSFLLPQLSAEYKVADFRPPPQEAVSLQALTG